MTQILKYNRLLILFGIILFFIPGTAAVAGDENANELREQQQKLQHLLDEIDSAREQRTEQKAQLEKLSKKMKCNWTLIQDYDSCDKKYKDQPKEQLTCVNEAKEKASGCLSEIDEMSQ